MHNLDPTIWLPQTKLAPPHMRANLVPRPRLLATLQQTILAHALTLVSAPTGYGKTTILTMLHQTSLHLPLAWLTLDRHDNDPVQLLTGLIATFQQLHPALGQRAQTLLTGLSEHATPHARATVPRVIGALINDLLTSLSTPTVLLLDDVHLLTEPTLLDGLNYLIEITQQRYAAAEAALRQAIASEPAVYLASLFCSAAPLLAHVALTRQRPQEALTAFAPLLTTCATLDTPGRIMLEGPYVLPLLRLAVEHDVQAPFAQRILDIMTAHQPASTRALLPFLVPETGETLTVREVEVLQLLAMGNSNQAIADQLIISVQTVKSHVAHILRKLDVTSRTQAAVRARALGIVP